MSADFGEASFFVGYHGNVITQSGGRKLTYIMMVAIYNLHVEYGLLL
jgi:hypothetical protein